MTAMEDATRNEVAESLEQLAGQAMWNLELWKRSHDLVKANWDNEVLAYVYDDVVHYSGEFRSRNIFGFRVKPNRTNWNIIVKNLEMSQRPCARPCP